jgi:OOP family OmpA-OmpF porin
MIVKITSALRSPIYPKGIIMFEPIEIKSVIKKLATALALGVATNMSYAVERSDVPSYVSGMMTITNADSDRNVESSNRGWQIGAGIPLSGRLFIEGIYFDNVLETNQNNSADYYQRGIGADLAYSFGDRQELTPFLLIGAGMIKNDVVPDTLDDDTMYWNVGGGIVGRIADLKWLRYRGEVRLVNDDYVDGMSDVRFSLGLEVALGSNQSAVNKEVVVEKIVYRNIVVAPSDNDNDGIVDQLDRCPNTLPGARVDSTGCVVEAQIININNVKFKTNSSILTAESKPILMSAVAFLKDQKNLNVEIAGHTDNMGDSGFNLNLSKNRAAAVRTFLLRNGFAPQRITARGYGESKPVATNATAMGRSKNRRVEFWLTKP